MISAYPACFYEGKDGRYSVVFPDLDYTATQGDTLQEAFAMAAECLASYLYTARIEDDPVPAPSSLQTINPKKVLKDIGCEGDISSCFVNMITVDADSFAKTHFEKSVKKTLSIPAWLNEAAKAQHINFSKTLQKALRQELGL